jgi:hypothetical protein
VTQYPSYKGTEGEQIRIDNFIDTLELLSRYKAAARAVIPSSTVKQTLNYIQNNGVQIYGMTITGPSKQLLKLKEEAFIAHIRLGEVRLWNWEERIS